MDSSRYPSNGWDGRRSGRSSRNRKAKTSFLSLRLDPEFDPKDPSKYENGVSNNNSGNKGQNNDELDPKTMSFEELVKLLHPTFITDYLQKVLQYLRSDKLEICFPNLAPFKEEFLLKIADNNDHLRCNKFSHASATVATQILDTLILYKGVYKWTYSFDNGRSAKNVLVYKKMYYNKSQTPQPADNFKAPYSTSNTSAPISLASSLEDLNINKNDNRPDSRQESIPNGLKIQTLIATLKFIKDDNQFTLDYPEMQRHHAEFLYTLLNSPNHKNCHVGFGFKSLYSTLFETMEKFEQKYDFKASLSKSFDVRMAQLKLQKMVKDDRQSRQSNSHNVSSTSLSTEGVDTTNLSRKEERVLESKRKLIQSLPEYFMKRSLMEVVDFIADESRRSLEFSNIDCPESRFLECVTGLARGKEFHQLFSEDCAGLLRKISRSYTRDAWKLQMDVGKQNKRTKLRTLTMYKVPMSKKGSARNSSMSERLDDTRNDSSCSIDSSVTPRNRSKSKERNSSRRSGGLRSDRDNNSARASDRVTSKLKSTSKDRRNQPPIGGIAFQSAGAQLVDSSLGAEARADGRTRERGLPARKSKLIEAMSTPLESDRAERMMRLMGWEGGALGARGEGITEPLIPALHILPGAGLGHVKQAPSAPRTPQDFRRYFLQDLLTFLESNERETAIAYAEPLSKREARFVKPAVNAFNDRKNIGLARDQEVRLVKRVSAFMSKELDLRVECSIADDKRQVKLKKISDPYVSQKSSRKRRKKGKQLEPEFLMSLSSSQTRERDREERVNPEEVPMLNTIMDLEKTCHSLKSAKALAYKMLFLQKIKDFLSIEDSEKEYKFDCILNIKQRTYVQGVVTSINKREIRAKYSSQMETDMYREMRKIAGDCYMSVVFDSEKFILKKKYYQKRFTNSALDLPPPKSKDTKNTVIYSNSINVHDSHSRNNIVNEDDDDVIVLNDHDDDIILLCESDAIDSATESLKTGLVDSVAKTTNSVVKNTNSITNTTDRNLYDEQDSDICDDTLSKDASIDISNESLMLDMLEAENGVADTNINHISDLDLENDTKGPETTILDTDNNEVSNLEAPEEENNESSLAKCTKTSDETHSFGSKRSSLVRKDLEINNNFNVVENRNNATVDAIAKIDNSDENDAMKDNETSSASPESGIMTDQQKDLSPSSSKRSRSDSEDSDKISKKYKKIQSVTHVRITSEEEMTIDKVLKLQSQISESIDNSFFLPLLQCHGIKNGGLIYSCHDEKSLQWLKKVLSELYFDVTDTDYFEDRNNKLKFRINYIDGIEKVLSRLELYNTGLNTNFWEVTNVQTNEGYEIITVLVDDDSFKFISEANYSLHAGVDKALFSVVWE